MSIEITSEKKTQIGQVTVTFTVGRIVSQAKETKGKAGMAVGQPHVRRNNRRSGFRVGEASAELPATSEFMDVTGRRDAHSNSELSLRRANASDVLWGAHPLGPGRKTGSDLAHVPAVETLANMGVTAGETAPNSSAVAETDANAPDDTRLVSGASSDPTSQPPESGER